MPTGRSSQSGFTYLFVLMLVALVGLGLGAAGTLWRTESQRAREAELLFVGNQYRQAIRSYYQLDPAQPRLPKNVDDLLEDRRRPDIVRHLRRAWRDPMTGGELVLVEATDGSGIVGVRSAATGKPFKTDGFAAGDEGFAEAETYSDWQFIFEAPAPQTPKTPSTAAGASPAPRRQ